MPVKVMYARVIKIYGQGNVDVMCNDKVRLCVIVINSAEEISGTI